jgi:tripartite ATP-independent transporter DctM subunit
MIAAGTDEAMEVCQNMPRHRIPLKRLENLALAGLLAAMLLLPLTAVLLRMMGIGFAGGIALLQHLTLVVCMLGAAVAARDGKLLALFSLAALGGRRWRLAGQALGHGFGAWMAALLGFASLQLVATEREAGEVLAYGIPVWAVQAVMPTGFALIAWRMLQAASGRRLLKVLVGASLLLLAATTPWWTDHADLLWLPALILAILCGLAGAPIFALLAAAPMLLFWRQNAPIASVALDHYSMVVNPSLPTIPLFTLAGFLLSGGRAAERLTRLFRAWFGHIRGGIAIATVVVGAIFTAFTGASGVTVLALGGVLLPLLRQAGYRERDSIGLVTVSGSLGVLVAPCLTLVLYAIVARIPIERMFLGAAAPALLMVALVGTWGMRSDTRNSEQLARFDWTEAVLALRGALWELGLGGVVFVSLFGGYATPVEASALTAFYVLLVETLVYRDLRNAGKLLALGAECGSLVGGVLLILGVALGLTNYLVDADVPARLTEWVQATIQRPWVFLLALNGLLVTVGCLMEVFAAIVILPPLLVPLGTAFGLDPVHLGVIFLANLELGLLTPLVGINLFYASSRFNKPLPEICRSVLPLFPVLAAGVLAITYLPWLSTGLLHLIR